MRELLEVREISARSTEVLAAAKGNVVPKLAERPAAARASCATVDDAGVIPIVGYGFTPTDDNRDDLDISYLSPKDADARAGDRSSGGCTIVSTATGQDTGTVPVGLIGVAESLRVLRRQGRPELSGRAVVVGRDDQL
ncbi:MAG: hypothetical protein QOH27_3077 [Mycobacterium sp.]|nr:hypothetical protein [Mycobacterium sp.]